MSRFDGKLEASSEPPVEAQELLAALRLEPGASERSRQIAIACYLSAAEGWRDARHLLGGAFAADVGKGHEVKDD